MTIDPLEDASRLVAQVGECYGRARRYRAIAAECETRFLGRALALGSELRALARTVSPNADTALGIVDELQRIVAECAEAVAMVHASASYQTAARAWDAGDVETVAALAPEIFDGIVADAREYTLYLPITVTSGRRGGEHFLAASALVDRIAGLLRDGIPAADPPPELGADARLRAVVLDDDPDAGPSPITLALPPGSIEVPRVRLEPAGEVLVYTPRLMASARIRCAATVSDEWWAVRPDAYRRYVEALAVELTSRGVAEIERE